jgi:hypothetical protein
MRLLIFLSLLNVSVWIPLEKIFLKPISQPFQKFCLERSQRLTEMRPPVESLVCGKKPNRSSELQMWLVHLGLIHIFVISGSHLTFLKSITKNYVSGIWQFLLLLLFTLMSGAEPPIVRALIFVGFVAFVKPMMPMAPSSLWISIVGTLLVFTIHKHALSIALTWTATLVIFSFQQKSEITRALAFYVFLFPLLMLMQVPHPFALLPSFVLNPLIGTILLPLSLLTWALPILEILTIWFWNFTLFALRVSNYWVPAPYASLLKAEPIIILLYPMFLHLLFWWNFTRKRRNLLCQKKL